MGFFRKSLLAACIACATSQAFAQWQPLTEAVQDALQFNADYRATVASRDATAESVKQAFGALLPQVSYAYSRGDNVSDQSAVGTAQAFRQEYASRTQQLVLKQTLFRPRSWYAYTQSGDTLSQAEFVLISQIQQVYVRAISSYLDLVQHKATIEAEEQVVQSARLAGQQASRLQLAGEASKVEATSTAAREAQSRVDLADAQRSYALSLRVYENVVGKRPAEVSPSVFLGVVPQPLPPLDELRTWMQESNPDMQAKQAAIAASKKEIRKSASDHLPTIDLVATKGRSDSGSETTIGRTIDTTSIGVQVNIPIFAGGATQAVVRQAVANSVKAEEEFLSVKRRVEIDLESYYYSMQTAAEKIEASRLMVAASEVALKAAQDGYKSGAKTLVDELDAKARLARARRDSIKAAIDYVKAYVQLWGVVGRLDMEFVGGIEAGIRSKSVISQ